MSRTLCLMVSCYTQTHDKQKLGWVWKSTKINSKCFILSWSISFLNISLCSGFMCFKPRKTIRLRWLNSWCEFFHLVLIVDINWRTWIEVSSLTRTQFGDPVLLSWNPFRHFDSSSSWSLFLCWTRKIQEKMYISGQNMLRPSGECGLISIIRSIFVVELYI